MSHRYEDVARHFGHAVEIALYSGGENVAIECTDCGEVILDYDRPEGLDPDYIKSEAEGEIMRCSNPDCTSRTGDDTAVFSTHVLIDAWGDRTDTVGDIPADEHTCVYCQSEAEEIE